MAKVRIRNLTKELLPLSTMTSDGKIAMEYILGKGSRVLDESVLLSDTYTKEKRKVISIRKLR